MQNHKYGVFQGFGQVRSAAFGVAPITATALIDNFIAKLYREECLYYTGNYYDRT